MNQQPSKSSAYEPGFGILPLTLRVLCLLPFLTGAADLILGIGVLEVTGTVLSPRILHDAVINNQVRFWGAIWLGYGFLLWWVSAHLQSGAAVFRILLITLLLSGLGRAVSVALYGWPDLFLSIAMVVELTCSVALWWWHNRLLHRLDQVSPAAVDARSFPSLPPA